MSARSRLVTGTFCLGTMMSFYTAQGLFFVAASGLLSTEPDPVRANGNLLLLAVLPFIFAGLFITPLLDELPVRSQIIGLKCLRAAVMMAAGLAANYGVGKVLLIYLSVLIFDLCFYVFQSTSARMSKELTSSLGIRLVETLSYLGAQAGMSLGAVVAGLLVTHARFGTILIWVSLVELCALPLVRWYAPDATESPPKEAAAHRKTFWVTLLGLRKAAGLANLGAFALLFPVYLSFNLIVGPWAQHTYADSGRMLGWITAAVGVGAALVIFLFMRKPELRVQRVTKISPLVFAALTSAIYFTRAPQLVLLYCVGIGMALAASRVVIRSAFIEAVQGESVGTCSMVATMIGAVTSLAFVSFVSSFNSNLAIGFGAVVFAAAAQGLMSLWGRSA